MSFADQSSDNRFIEGWHKGWESAIRDVHLALIEEFEGREDSPDVTDDVLGWFGKEGKFEAKR